MLKVMLTSTLIASFAATIAPSAQANTTLFESRDVLTPQQALGRFQWLEKCYPGLLVEVSDNIFDPTTPIPNDEKIANLKKVMLYKNSTLRTDAKYLTFGDEDNANPKNWFAGKSPTTSCLQIPSDYRISAVMITPAIPNYCTTKSRERAYEFIKSVKFSNIENTSSNTFYSNYVGDTAKIYADKSYQLTLTPGFSSAETYPETWHVFIDWNQDGDFNDTKETLFAGVSEQAVQVEITPPTGAKKGMTKMRVTMDYLGGSNDACKEVDSGEVEDYLLYVK
ncbi:GEVED domain-containing protein [Pseudoalteromonas sp. L23]|uniref:GEVED domain-containing protein n=1 Tax=unclassified Pseudoalteromonas TaxID=194690 RepID=UPI001EF0ACAF|nr:MULTISPECIES: GEVED domain-containing protein [unclassified Pseudoalteromonas]MCF7515240.1 GEVED domain-containing protein [Pseudoalteromonas sp. L7]MCF7527230.1 GEVED domain-containing protein [Pseudoalteromonas sp. L23]MCG7555913.1 GEVED domain-containing protein [Pseudoalteromonas sp. Of11M-6]MCX2767086.1 GEVED domain-containing protein [Pseudoalteromonas sp. B530]